MLLRMMFVLIAAAGMSFAEQQDTRYTDEANDEGIVVDIDEDSGEICAEIACDGADDDLGTEDDTQVDDIGMDTATKKNGEKICFCHHDYQGKDWKLTVFAWRKDKKWHIKITAWKQKETSSDDDESSVYVNEGDPATGMDVEVQVQFLAPDTLVPSFECTISDETGNEPGAFMSFVSSITPVHNGDGTITYFVEYDLHLDPLVLIPEHLDVSLVVEEPGGDMFGFFSSRVYGDDA